MATQYVTCPNCKSQNTNLSTACSNCGMMLPVSGPMQPGPNYGQAKPAGADKKILAGVMGIVLGGLGIHKFVLGYTQEGVIMLSVYVVSIVVAMITCGIGVPLMFITPVIGIVEGIMYLTKSDEEFVDTYITHKKPWF
jgi:TM2 domain-containing membrane protein YozV